MIIAITGCGWVTPRVAGDIPTVLAAYASCGQIPQTKSRYEPICDEVLAPFTNLPAEAAKEDAIRLAAVAIELAWKQAGLNKDSYPSDRKGLVLGSALAGVSGMIDFANDVREQSPRFVSPIRFPQTVGNYISGALARCYDFRGPISTIACGAASSLEAIREGCALLASDQADVVIAGGSERLSDQLVEGLHEPDVTFADGACLFVLESEPKSAQRGARSLAKVAWNEDWKDSVVLSEQPVLSVAGYDDPHTCSIEYLIGRTLGTDGAAALATGIGISGGPMLPSGQQNMSAAEALKHFMEQENKPIRFKLLVRATDMAGHVHELSVVGGVF